MSEPEPGFAPAPPAPSVVVVIPTYDERENLGAVATDVLALGDAYRLIVVDDASPDGTGELAEALVTAHPGRVRVLHRPAKRGIGPAYVAGFRLALEDGAELIAQMDADRSHDPADLPRLVAAAATHDLVLGSRYVPGGGTTGWPLGRRLLSRLGGRYARAVLGVPIADLTGGFKVWRRGTLAALDLAGVRADGYGFQIETTYRALRRGARVIELPIVFADRVAGASKLSRRIVLEAAIVVWRLRLEGRRAPLAAGGRAAGDG
jgi:dolichol-phosphate mannosyltransferase